MAITDLKESLQTLEFTDEDLIHLDELKNYFENDNLPEVKESQIHVLGKLTQMSFNNWMSFRIKSSEIKTWHLGDNMSPLSNANYYVFIGMGNVI